MLENCLTKFQKGIEELNMPLSNEQIVRIKESIINLLETYPNIRQERFEINLYHFLHYCLTELDPKFSDDEVEALKDYMGYPIPELDVEFQCTINQYYQFLEYCQRYIMDEEKTFWVLFSAFKVALGNEQELTENQKLIIDILISEYVGDIEYLYQLLSQTCDEEDYQLLQSLTKFGKDFKDNLIALIYGVYLVEENNTIDIHERIRKITGKDERIQLVLRNSVSLN